MEPLGRGLESLIPDKKPDEAPAVLNSEENIAPPMKEEIKAVTASSSSPARTYEDHFMPRRGESIFWIEIEKIEPNPFQPRREFEETALQDLASSIREHGVLQPILVTKREIETPTGLDVFYQLIAGERRWRAAKLAGISQIPAIIRRGVPDDRIRLELALIENVQREDLNALERAHAFKQLLDEFHLVHKEIAARIGKSREMVSNTMRLLTLPPYIQESLQTGRITEGHARAILMGGDDLTKQKAIYEAILMDRLNVREAENRARQISGRVLTPRKRPSAVQDPIMRDWQNRLQEKLGTRVQLQKVGDRGRIVVEFFSEEELRGILNKLINES